MGNIGKIRIEKDSSNTYKVGEVVDLWDFFHAYKGKCKDESLWGYLTRIPIPAAVKMMTEELGIEYEYV